MLGGTKVGKVGQMRASFFWGGWEMHAEVRGESGADVRAEEGWK